MTGCLKRWASGPLGGCSGWIRSIAEWKRQRREVFVPLTYRPGDLAEVDFFEVLVDIDGTRRKAWLFLMRLMYSGRDFAWIYERQDQVSFLDGHVRAFAHFGGVPARLAISKPPSCAFSSVASARSPSASRHWRRTICLSRASVAPARATTKGVSKRAAKRSVSKPSPQFRRGPRSTGSMRRCSRASTHASTRSAMSHRRSGHDFSRSSVCFDRS